MKIKMRVSFSGAGFAAGPGDEIERPNDEAIRLITKGYADPLGHMPVVETAVRALAPETRELPPGGTVVPPEVQPAVEAMIASDQNVFVGEKMFGGKGDHDNNGKVGGAAKPAPAKHKGKRR